MAADVIQRHFTQISNRLFRDPRISFKAKGIFGLISTHRTGYGVTPEWIAASSTDGVTAVKTGLRELERYGYLVRDQERRPDGTHGPMTYSITDMPSSQPPVENPPAADPPADDRHHKKIKSKKTRRRTPPSPSRTAESVDCAGVGREQGASEDETAPGCEDKRAADFVDSLPFRGRRPGRTARLHLVGRVTDAFAAGWTDAELRAQLTRETAGAESLLAVYQYRLAPGELPDAPAGRRSAGRVRAVEPAGKGAPPPVEELARTRAALRALKRAKHHRER
nr:hypothetical protein [Streptomyces sp. SID5468]